MTTKNEMFKCVFIFFQILQDYYPLNLLRNVALNATKTPLSYLSDVDFVPANGTERMIEKLWTNNESFFDSNVSTM